MKKQILLILFSLSFIYGSAQKAYKIDYDTKNIEGTWIATSGIKSYEITFVKQTICFEKIDKNVSFEAIIGSIKYLENNKIIKTVSINGSESPLITHFKSHKKFDISYREEDNGKVIYGKVNFDISEDGKTAQWYKLRTQTILESTKENFDIPKELTFTKKN